MREGYYTDAYFNHARDTLLADGVTPRRHAGLPEARGVLGGMDEAIAVLKLCSHDWEALTVHALYDGDEARSPRDVMTIEGDYTLFAHLETVYLGVLARRTLVSTNTRRVIEAANRKPIIFMPARHDHHRIQTGDGYAAHLGWGHDRLSDRRHDGRAGLLVGREGRRHGPPRAHLGLRWEHRARGDEVRRMGRPGTRPTSTSPSS
jgi:nicotinic acid phosphoribosyltransferase